MPVNKRQVFYHNTKYYKQIWVKKEKMFHVPWYFHWYHTAPVTFINLYIFAILQMFLLYIFYNCELQTLKASLDLLQIKVGFRQACRSSHYHYIAWSTLAVSVLKQQPCRFGFSTKLHHSQVEKKSTVCGLLLWAKRRGYRLIGFTLLTAWSFLCGEWRLRSCT